MKLHKILCFKSNPIQRAAPSSQRQGANEKTAVSWGEYWSNKNIDLKYWSNKKWFKILVQHHLPQEKRKYIILGQNWQLSCAGGAFQGEVGWVDHHACMSSLQYPMYQQQYQSHNKYLNKKRVPRPTRQRNTATQHIAYFYKSSKLKTFRRSRFVRFATFSGCVSLFSPL